jgi:predicted GIY-YIG superfamily endonuclease
MAPPHHHVYVVFLRNPRGDGRAGYYVGMTGLTPDERFANHKNGIKGASIVKRCGERLVPKL